MKRKLLLLSLSILTLSSLQAQTTLQSGERPAYYPIKLPYFSYDLMRTEHESWLREYLVPTTQKWVNANYLINKKGADGRFDHLEYRLWVPELNEWMVFSSYQSNRTIINNKLSNEENAFNFRQSISFPVYSFDVVNRYQYDNDILQLLEVEHNEIDINFTTFHHFKYDQYKNLISDSTVNDLNGNVFINKYGYDAINANCIWDLSMVNGDSVFNTDYFYEDNRLTGYISYLMRNGNWEKLEEQHYEYNALHKLSKIYYTYYEEGDKVNTTIFEQGYHDNGKLAWMTSKSIENNSPSLIDSVVIPYVNNQVDTGYGYISWDGTQWDEEPTYRFVFNAPLSSGINKNNEVRHSVIVYPNPASNVISVQTDKQVTKLVLKDLTGKVIRATQNESTLHIDGVEAGVYLLETIMGDYSSNTKILVK
jgi:hypothetical protein